MNTLEASATESARIKALRDLDILDTAPEPEFDELVQIAAAICGAPMSVVSLLDEDRQWCKAAFGMEFIEARRELAFCNHTIRQSDILLVEDATRDVRFADNPFVTGEPRLRFYAGIAVASPSGHAVGTLCVLDSTPRTLTQEQRTALKILAKQINARLELRLRRRELQRALTEAEATKAQLLASERRFQSFMDAGPFLSYLKDAAGRMLYYNAAMARHFDVSRTFMLNKTDAELWSADLARVYERHDAAVLAAGELQVSEEETSNPDGSTSVWRSYKFPCTDADGRPLLGGVSLDVTQELRKESRLKQAQEELEAVNRRLRELASLDALTGLANRRTFDERLDESLSQARRGEERLCLLLLDVDDFKHHNDRFGHQHGDEVLRKLARTLGRQLRGSDLLARYGGEEFAILLPQTSEKNACSLAERLVKAVRLEHWPNSPVTVSIGLSTLCPATRDSQHLITRADEALYAAKRTGKDRVVPYSHIYDQVVAELHSRKATQNASFPSICSRLP